MSIKEAPRDIVPPLYNPRPVKMPDMQDRQMTLHGYESRVDGRRVVAHVQYWVLLPLAAKEDVVEQKAQ
jgi:hypothetical protein